MSKTKIVLGATLPDFKNKVEICAPNGEVIPLEMTFKHHRISELADLFKGKTNAQSILEIASGWELEEEFTEDNIKELIDLYPSASAAIIKAYNSALIGERVKN